MGDARVEFRAGEKLLGRPVPEKDGRTFRLPLNGTRVGPDTDVRALAGGRRLDAEEDGGRARSPHRAPVPRPAAELPANPVDPGTPGRYRTVRGEYDLKSIRVPGLAAPVEMRATVVGPANAPGTRPLALFLHGRHTTCYGGDDGAAGAWPCPAGTKPVPSEKGYLDAQKLLASQGYVTVSIAANGINGQDGDLDDGGAQARSTLVRTHLARWADWSAHRSTAPAAVRAIAPADLSRVMLIGHSRGGEGVNRAALDSLNPPPGAADGYRGPVRWKIRGNVLIGPTIFGQNPEPDVPSVTLLPGCDGDVSDLQGQVFTDGPRGVSNGTALHSSVYLVGANHNFFNTEWTPGLAKAPAEDDFWSGDTSDPVCSPGTRTRLSAEQQRKAGDTYIAAAARLFVAGDDKVRPLLDGTGRRAPSAGPARVLTHATGGRRTPAFLPDAATVTGGRVCDQGSPDRKRACLPEGTTGSSPHFASWETSQDPGRTAVELHWSKAGAPVRVRPARPVSLAGAQSLALRLMVPPNTTGTRLDVALTDASGRRAVLGDVRVDGLPGSERTASYWGRELRVPLAAATRAKLDLKRIASLELTPRTRAGQAWLMDGWGWNPGTAAVRPASLARVDLGQLSVQEGDSGKRTYRIPVRVSGHGTGVIRLFSPGPGQFEVTPRTVRVRPGDTSLDIPVTVTGNTRYSDDIPHPAFAKAVRGTVIGSYRGGVTVRNDDPLPKVSVAPVPARVTEGRPMTWRVSLSAPADTSIGAELRLLPVKGGAELSTLDVDPTWLANTFGEKPAPARPLSGLGSEPTFYVDVNPGSLTATLEIPVIKDKVREPEEALRLEPAIYDNTGKRHTGPAATGTVVDAG
ncbi:hypothetical protein NX801_05740 [Streptomyces sp. LP05-1]|uniref:Secreted protein n=2 Tax=Streptomyces pyxinae TaxID=2970734 RepID=A0ABT2CCR3_9ACTN|nr:hypothetical protein [Streptomyces sp. LP05-1]MCS0635166.1 hypothetical protein [Streptomyces sp. LP05-1]